MKKILALLLILLVFSYTNLFDDENKYNLRYTKAKQKSTMGDMKYI